MKQGKQSSGFWKDRMKTILLDGSTTKLRAGILVSDPCFVTTLCVILDGVTAMFIIWIICKNVLAKYSAGQPHRGN